MESNPSGKEEMWIELPNYWIIILNCIGIPAVHLLISLWSNRMPANRFEPERFIYRSRPWESSGKIYPKIFLLPLWKNYLPDAAPWFKGVSKKNLNSKDIGYLRNFSIEACRGEFSHWLQMIALMGFVIWNPFPANLVIVVYSLISNLPCILNLRYTRARLMRVIRIKESVS